MASMSSSLLESTSPFLIYTTVTTCAVIISWLRTTVVAYNVAQHIKECLPRFYSHLHFLMATIKSCNVNKNLLTRAAKR